MLPLLLFLLFIILCCIIAGVPTAFFAFLIYLVGIGIATLFNKNNRRKVLSIFSVLFSVAGIYMLVSYQYMIAHNYDYLLASDVLYFNSRTEHYLNLGNYFDALKEIWHGFNFVASTIPSYFTYSTLFAYAGEFVGANFYIGQNLSVLLLYSFVGVVLYKIMLSCKLDNGVSYKYAFILSFFSILFLYSFVNIRDTHVLLIYLLGIYLTMKPEFKISILIGIIFISLVICTLRFETGLFSLTLIPVYLLSVLNDSKQRGIVLLISVLFIGVGLILLYKYSGILMSVYDQYEADYITKTYSSSMSVGIFGKIPIIGDLILIILGALRPIPFWSTLWTSSAAYIQIGPETMNLMRFPNSISVIFNIIVLTYIFVWLVSKNLRSYTKNKLSKPFIYQLWVGLLFLFLQNRLGEQRRWMAYYCVYFILFVIINTSIPQKKRNNLMLFAISGAVVFEILTSILYVNTSMI